MDILREMFLRLRYKMKEDTLRIVSKAITKYLRLRKSSNLAQIWNPIFKLGHLCSSVSWAGATGWAIKTNVKLKPHKATSNNRYLVAYNCLEFKSL